MPFECQAIKWNGKAKKRTKKYERFKCSPRLFPIYVSFGHGDKTHSSVYTHRVDCFLPPTILRIFGTLEFSFYSHILFYITLSHSFRSFFWADSHSNICSYATHQMEWKEECLRNRSVNNRNMIFKVFRTLQKKLHLNTNDMWKVAKLFSVENLLWVFSTANTASKFKWPRVQCKHIENKNKSYIEWRDFCWQPHCVLCKSNGVA